MTGSASPADTGLAAHRTTLSWTRTALVAAAFGALQLRNGLAHDSPLSTAAAALALLAAIVIGLLGRRRAATVQRAITAGRSVTGQGAVLLVAVLTSLAGILTAVSITWPS